MQKHSLYLKAKKVTLLILDVDGVLTDGALYLGDEKEYFKAFHVHDGLGIRLLLSTGVNVAVITARQSPIVTHRLESLGVTDIHQGVQQKFEVYQALLSAYQLTAEQVAYMGDDLPDLKPLADCGFGVCVPEAQPMLQDAAVMVTEKGAGRGAVREVCDFIMHAKGSFQAAVSPYQALATNG